MNLRSSVNIFCCSIDLNLKVRFEKLRIEQKKTFGEIEKIYLTPYGI